jgi:hypothetical protein
MSRISTGIVMDWDRSGFEAHEEAQGPHDSRTERMQDRAERRRLIAAAAKRAEADMHKADIGF